MKKTTKSLFSHIAIAMVIMTSSSFAQTSYIVAKLNFSVDMKYQIARGTFVPGTDFVDVAGLDVYGTGTNASKDWNTYTKATAKRVLKPDPNNSNIYIGTFIDTVPKPANSSVFNVTYKFRINGQWGNSDQSPSGDNRLQDVSDDAKTYDVPTVVYLNESGTIYKKYVKFIVNMRIPAKAKKFTIGTDFVDVTCFDGNCDTRTDKATNPNVLTFLKDSTYTITKAIMAVIPDGSPKTLKVKYTFRINGAWANRDTAENKVQDPLFPDRQFIVDFSAPNDYIANVIYQGKGSVVTGINEITESQVKVQIQNPVNETLAVFSERSFNYEVFDITGQGKKAGYSNNGEISVVDLVPGMYFLKITTDKINAGVVRFIKL